MTGATRSALEPDQVGPEREPQPAAGNSITDLRPRDLPWNEVDAALRADWAQMLEGGGIDLSLHPAWLEAIGSAHRLIEQMRVCTIEHDGERQLLFPYWTRQRRMYGIPVAVVEAGSNLASYHPEVIVSDATALEPLFAAAMAHLPERWDVLHFAGLRSDGPTACALRLLGHRPRWRVLREPGERSPYIRLDGGWTQLLESKSHKFRYNLKRKHRRLANSGRLEERWFTSSADVDELLEVMLSVEGTSWKQTAGTAIGARSHEQTYYGLLLPVLAGIDAMRANALFLDGTPIAYSLCYRWLGRWGQMKTSFSDALRAISPGSVVIARAIRRACEEGADEFDFLGGTMPHKLEWSNDVRAHENIYLYSPTARARVLGLAKAWRDRMRRRRPTSAEARADEPSE